MTRRDEARRAYDVRRRAALPYRAWYASKAWWRRKHEQLSRVPWCEPCKAEGKSRKAAVANHNPPHRGDRVQFFTGPLESCCKPCHDGMVQRAEGEGFRRTIGEDGWPTDPQHPMNRRGR